MVTNSKEYYERNQIRKENALYFESLISDLDFIDFQTIPEGAASPVCSFGCPCYNAEYKLAEYLENSECLNNCAILLAPRFENVTKEDIEQHAEAYRKIVALVDELLEYAS